MSQPAIPPVDEEVVMARINEQFEIATGSDGPIRSEHVICLVHCLVEEINKSLALIKS